MAKSKYRYKPDYSVAPGNLLKEYLEVRGWSYAECARRCELPPKLISEIASGKAPIEPSTALQFEKVLGMDADIWLGMEQRHRLFQARKAERKETVAKADWAQNFPVKELVKFGKIQAAKLTDDVVHKVLSFFGVASIEAWESSYGLTGVAWRRSQGLKNERAALATWLRFGEIEAVEQRCSRYSKTKFWKAVRQIRRLTREPDPQISLPQARKLCNEAGVVLAMVPPLQKVTVSGAAYWLTPQKAVVQLSGSHSSDDQLWFSFFHEAAHILLHNKKSIFIEAEEGSDDSHREQETEANAWAANHLIPNRDWKRFVDGAQFSKESVVEFAERQNVAPGIVVGRLQHEKFLSRRSSLNSLKKRYTWEYIRDIVGVGSVVVKERLPKGGAEKVT